MVKFYRRPLLGIDRQNTIMDTYILMSAQTSYKIKQRIPIMDW